MSLSNVQINLEHLYQFLRIQSEKKKKDPRVNLTLFSTVSIDKSDEKGKYHTPMPQKKNRDFTDEELEKEASLLLMEKQSRQK